MLFLLRTFITLGLVLASQTAASPFKRSPTLTVSVSTTKSTTNSIDEIKILAKVENIGDAEVKVLKYGSVLDSDLATQSFIVTQGDQTIPFTGVKLQLSIENLKEDSYVVIPAGGSVEATHTNLGPLYAFHQTDTRAFTFAPKQEFLVPSTGGLRKAMGDILTVVFEGPSVDVHVSGDVSKRELVALEERSVFTCTVVGNSSFIATSYTEGTALATLAANYIKDRGTSDPLFQEYFGATTSSKPYTVFTTVAAENSTTRTLDCSDPLSQCLNGVIAYTEVSTTNIFYCPIFFDEVSLPTLCTEPATSLLYTAAGTTLHELTHALADTNDHQYGCPEDKDLAASSPTTAMDNADNYNCFAEAVYAATKC